MNRHLLLLLTAATLLWSTSSHAAGDGTLGYGVGINDNPHNLSSKSTTPVGETDIKSTNSTEICVFCHTPHSARSIAPLWGRPDSTGTFNIRAGLQISDPAIVNTTLYSTTADYPNGATKVCLSCHDGVTAIGILANGDEILISGGNALGINLTTSHPVSFVYNSAVQIFLGATYKLPTTAYLDSKSRVQCTSCHQPHQDTKGTGTGTLPFWRYGNGTPADYDPVCQACHTSTPTTYTIPNSHTH